MADEHAMDVVQIEYLSNEELDNRDRVARQAFAYKLARVLQYEFMRIALPTIEDIYRDPFNYLVTFAPEDMQLPLYLMQYEEIAQRKFTARPSFDLREHTINRAIWYWNVDPTHSFHRFFENTRYNILIMVFAWASGFDRQYFPKPGVEGFVRLFVSAWFESLVVSPDWRENTFYAREKFLDYWKRGGLDLINFSVPDLKKLKKISKKLMATKMDDSFEEDPKEFISKCRNGTITGAQFEKYGPMLALRWLHAYQQEAEDTQASLDEQQEFDGQELKKWMESNKEDIAEQGCGVRVVSNAEGGHPLTNVDWDSDALRYLDTPIQPNLPNPLKLKFAASDEDKQWFWADPHVIFDKIFEKKNTGMDVEMGEGDEDVEKAKETKSIGMALLSKLLAGTCL